MAEKERTLQEILAELISHLIPIIRNAFLASISDVTNRVILIDVIDAVRNGDVEAAFRSLGLTQAAMRPITAALETAFEQGGITVGDTFPRVLNTPMGRGVFRFDVRNSRAEAFIRDQSSSLVTRIQEDARLAVRNVLHDGMAAGNNPRTTALDIVGRVNPATRKREGGIVGLTDQMERWQARARLELSSTDPDMLKNYLTRKRRSKLGDRIVAKAIKEGKPLDKATIDKLIARYKDNLLVLRGENIARTESVQSLNRAEFESYQQAVDMGATTNSEVKKTWDSAGDTRVRDDHQKLDGQTVDLLEAFTAPDGSKLMFPGDISLGATAKQIINCRCKTQYNVDWLAGVD